MPVQVVDEKAKRAVLMHPAQLIFQFPVRKVMTKQTGEYNIWFVLYGCFSVIAANPMHARKILAIFLGEINALLVYVHSGSMQFNAFSFAPVCNGFQVIASATANFTNMDFFVRARQCGKPCSGNAVPTQPVIDGIELGHILGYVAGWQAWLVNQLALQRTRCQVHTVVAEKVSTVSPGPNAAPNTSAFSGLFCILSIICFSTKRMVQEDILP